MTDDLTRVLEKYESAAELVISDLETLKVLADPLRLSIIEYLRKPGTVKQVAQKVGKPPTKLYYHFNLLEKHELIQMVYTRLVSGIVEKHYQQSARSYRVAHGLLSPGTEGFDEGLDAVVSGWFGSARENLRESLLAGVVDVDDEAPRHRRILFSQARLRLAPEEAAALNERLEALLGEYQHLHDEDEVDVETSYSCLVLMHPTARTGLPEESEQESE